MKIGVFSGSFDPVHSGHAMIASYARQWCGMDQIWLIPSRRNPLKENLPQATDSQRLEMLEMVADTLPGLVASDFEYHLPAPSYTYRTLCALRENYPEHTFRLIIGADNLQHFDRWRDWQLIIREFGLTVFNRPGCELTDTDRYRNYGEIEVVEDAPQMLISSTFIREKIAEGYDLNLFLPSGVYQYVKKYNIYGGSRNKK